jgi:eukaryotic-like serine/threonine-protein kinase
MTERPPSERSVFEGALEQPSPQARAAYLERACAGDAALRREVEALLAAHDRLNSLAAGAGDHGPAPTLAEPAAPLCPGAALGPYRLLQKLGEGGMGTVWLAEQHEPVRRQVALKVVKPGMDSKRVLGRFEAERQALALMDHPHIAKVLDAGATPEGRPYFVMELVRGVPLTQFCDDRRLPLRQRLELFVSVCQAVQHAHQKGVIHRDLKPSNVLVGQYDGVAVPKVIDFGLAKATGGRLTDGTLCTGLGQVVGTLEYMSPEQADFGNPDIDTRSDVYSLGVLLYELLTGSTPLEGWDGRGAGLLEVLRRIREEEPPRPSARLAAAEGLPALAAKRGSEPRRLSGLVRGELDWIALRALEKDRSRRYESASALAADVQRHLNDEPVSAGPPGAGYRLRKFLCRHRRPVLAAGLVLVALFAGIVGTTWGLVAAEGARQAEAEQRRLVEKERDAKETARQVAVAAAEKATKAAEAEAAERRQAEAVADLMESVFRGVDPDAERKGDPGLKAQLVAQLKRAAAKLETDYAGQALVRARLGHALGMTYLGLGEPATAVSLFRGAFRERRSRLGPDDRNTLGSHNSLGVALLAAGRTAEAIQVLEQVRQRRNKALGPKHLDTLATANNLAGAYYAAGRFAKAIRLHEQVGPALLERLGPGHPRVLNSVNNLAAAYQRVGRTEKSLQLHELVAKAQARALGPDHKQTLLTLNNLASAYQDADRVEDAIRLYQKVAALQAKKFGVDHPLAMTTLSNLATAYEEAGRTAEAIDLMKRVHNTEAKNRGPDHPRTLQTLANLGGAYRNAGRPAEAIPVLEQVGARQAKVLGADHIDALLTAGNLARAYLDVGRTAEAIPLLERVLARVAGQLGPDHQYALITAFHLARAHQKAGSTAEAIKLYKELEGQQTRLFGPDHSRTLTTLNNLALACLAAGRSADAIPLFEQLRAQRLKALGPDHELTWGTGLNLGEAYRRAGRTAEAIALLDQAAERYTKAAGPDHQRTRSALLLLGKALHDAGQFDRLETVCRRLLAAQTRKLPADHPGRAGTLAVLGHALLQTGKPAEAEKVLRECLKIREKILPDDWSTFNAQSLLGASLLAQKHYAAAEPLLLRGYEGLAERQARRPRFPRARLINALERIVSLYRATGQEDREEAWRNKLDALQATTPR